MAVDPYAMCPCGSGKKLKFCCSDLVGEIEKIHRMIEGEQPRAALRHVEQTLATHPGRASLLDLKATLELSLGDLDAARQTVKEFVAKNRDSPTAHACEAILLAEDDKPREAVDSLQRALAMVEREMPLRVFEALGAVGGALLEAGHILAAQAHLWLHAALAPKDDTRSREVLAALNHYSGLPLFLRDQLRFRPWPDNVPWKAEAEKATRLADNGKWQRSGRGHRSAGRTSTAPIRRWCSTALCWAVGSPMIAHSSPGCTPTRSWMCRSTMPSKPKPSRSCSTPISRRSGSIRRFRRSRFNDLDALVAKFSSDKRVQSFEMDPQAFADRDQPRPRNTFVLLDRPMPATGVGITRDAVPRLAGVLAIYGRQTDRPERLEFSIDKGPAFDTIDRDAQGNRRRCAGRVAGRKSDRLGFADGSGDQLALASAARTRRRKRAGN